MTRLTRLTVLTTLALASVAYGCSKSDTKGSPEKAPAASTSPTTGGERIAITVTEKGFEPENITVPSGKPVTLVFTRKTDKTCVREVIIPIGDKKIEKKLPLDETVAIDVTFPQGGAITYGCQMDMMFKGVITVQ